MRLKTLGVSNLRNIEDLRLELGPGFNVFIGPNGGGKTSILEAAYLLSHAQSFRAGSTDTLIRHGSPAFGVAGQVERDGRIVDLRLTRGSADWAARINGSPASHLGALLQEFALVCLEPGSHALISGGSKERRRFLDWGVFHVEPGYLREMRRYNRVLQQRNAVLKASPTSAELDTWDAALNEPAEAIERERSQYFRRFEQALADTVGKFLPELGAFHATRSRGWGEEDLVSALRAARGRDLARGFTSRGPHRADWSISFERAPAREHLSRGQEKLCALGCVLAQAKLYAQRHGDWPVLSLDDLASELDPRHQQQVIELTREVGAQVLITGTESPLLMRGMDALLFHVEHGQAIPLL